MTEKTTTLKNIIPPDLDDIKSVDGEVEDFLEQFEPLEAADILHIFVDARTKARFCECHILASKLLPLSTINVPLDPEEQVEYRANREIVANHVAFEAMKEDAKKRRAFSNIVAEFSSEFDEEHPLKIIGGQHRHEAIKEALAAGVDEYHGIKVYFALDPTQRLDVQLVSNTVIAVSTDLYDRMQETVKGPDLRNWCQKTGLLDAKKDFSDKKQRGAGITVRAARSFIMNFFHGKALAKSKFEQVETVPTICKSGKLDPDWESLRTKPIWKDAELLRAGKEFAALVIAQRNAFGPGKQLAQRNADFEEKALSYPILTAWAFVAGILTVNETRLQRHYNLKNQKGHDPLNAEVLVSARHRSDPPNYRGLGTRTGPKEMGRLVELFYVQAEQGKGIAKAQVDLALKKYHLKEAKLDLVSAESSHA
jgi:hypothetical protein